MISDEGGRHRNDVSGPPSNRKEFAILNEAPDLGERHTQPPGDVGNGQPLSYQIIKLGHGTTACHTFRHSPFRYSQLHQWSH